MMMSVPPGPAVPAGAPRLTKRPIHPKHNPQQNLFFFNKKNVFVLPRGGEHPTPRAGVNRPAIGFEVRERHQIALSSASLDDEHDYS